MINGSAVDRRQRHPSVFEIYLRTGRRVGPRNASYSFELKFNPWHDTANGQFTFAGGGGGFGGGGGASGSWAKPSSSRAPAMPATVFQPRQAPIAVRPPPSAPAQATTLAKPKQTQTVNGYQYEIDATGRTQQVSGLLRLNPKQSRSPGTQLDAGGTDRLPTDHGGHYIARRFDGPTEAFNHFAQDANFNQSGYRSLENQWAKATSEGKQVFVNIAPGYIGSSQRPATISVAFTINGSPERYSFTNKSKGTRNGK